MLTNQNPIIVGIAQYTQRKSDPQPLDPLNLMVKTSKKAIMDTSSEEIINTIDAVYMVNINSWGYEDAPGELSKALGIEPNEKLYLSDGGHSPQMLVNRAAKAIATGKHQCILITGGEAAYSIYKTFEGLHPKSWPKKKDPSYMEEHLWNFTDIEKNYGFRYPALTYALFETALQASTGRTPKQHRQYLGKLFERFSKVASENPYSWVKKQYSADEIITPSPDNRFIVYPYTKRMCANLFVNQASSVLITNEETAERLNINKNKWVHVMGGADLKNINNILQRPLLDDSPAIKEGTRLALEQAGLSLDDINAFDLYSCFPSIVEIIMKELGIKDDDPRDLTITGGLPFFGGPLSNYSLHSIISAVELIRKSPAKKVMIIANGGYNTKESIGIYGTTPPKTAWGKRDDSQIQEAILNEALSEPVDKIDGNLTILAYSLIYNRNNHPESGVVIGTLENGKRSQANITFKPEQLKKLEQENLVGKTCSIQYDSKTDRNTIIKITK